MSEVSVRVARLIDSAPRALLLHAERAIDRAAAVPDGCRLQLHSVPVPIADRMNESNE